MANNTFYRNKKALISQQGVLIDDGALWKKNKNNLLVLVDDDEYHTHPFDEDLFELSHQ